MQLPCCRIELKRGALCLLAVVNPQKRLGSMQQAIRAKLLNAESHNIGELYPG
jgi:hypothetical protein